MKITKILNTEKVYSGYIFDLAHYTVELPNGKEAKREVIVHNGAAVIVPVTSTGELVLVRQYRPGSDKMMLELPAGKLDGPGEDPQNCALRELQEETGYRANKIRPLLKLHPLAAYCTEQITMFLAEDLEPGASKPDEEEFVETELYSLPALLAMIDNGEISDMKTIMGILYYARLRSQEL